MPAKMKGFIKGFRYITQIFDDKEPEMEIGFPTDVKHVAHIGFDGPSANTPSWMDKFDSAPELSSNLNMGDVKKLSSQEASLPPNPQKPNHKSRRKQLTTDTGSPLNSPPKPSRRHRSSQTSMESATQESSNDSANNNPKKSRRRKSKGSSNDGSSRSSTRHSATFTELESTETGNAEKNNESHLNTVLGSCEEDSGRNGISREHR